jgi:hypothetical protein
MTVEKKLEQFIKSNYKSFSNLDNSEVEEIDVSEFDTDVIDYLKTAKHNRFDYNDICVYYVERENEIWVENMDS